MEHYYVVNGNEFGVDLSTKSNFLEYKDAIRYFDQVKFNDFGCMLVYVDVNGVEKYIQAFVSSDILD